MSLEETVQKILESVKHEKLSVIDLAQELSGLVDKVAALEGELKYAVECKNDFLKQRDKLEADLNTYKLEYATPAKALAKQAEEYKQKEFELAIERKYYTNTIDNLKNILSALCAKTSITGNFSGYGNNGISLNGMLGEETTKPQI